MFVPQYGHPNAVTFGGGGMGGTTPRFQLVAKANKAITFTRTGQNLANGVILSLNTNRELTVVAGGTGASTNFIVDITGYWL